MSLKSDNQRISFSSVKNRMHYPDFLEVQLKSFQDFFQLDTTAENRKNEGLYKVFMENFPITDTRNNFVLEFIDYYVDPPRYSMDECLERGLTYSVPLKAKLKLYCTDPEHEDFDTVIQDVYFGTIPYMTPRGTFIINGAERVIVSQLHRSPGVFFGQSIHTNGTKLYSARIIPFKGSWIEFATDIYYVMYAYIDRKKKLPVTTLLRAIGFESDRQILEIFDLAEDVKVTKTNLKKAVGQKLAARVLKTWVEDFEDEDTGEVVSIERNEIIIDRETVLEERHIDDIIESRAKSILIHKEAQNGTDFSIVYNTLQKDPCNSEKEAVVYIYRQLRNSEPPDEATARDVIEKLFFSDKRYDLGDVGRFRINKKLNLDISPEVRILTKEDMIAIIRYLISLINSKTDVDDIDHLSNRRVRTVGEQLANQFSVGFVRMARTIRERMNVRDNEVFTPVDLINAKTLSSVINSFFGTNQLSQFMDQTNPLAELTHKRRLSALGPGGLSRERAGFEVRDVHYSHYGRMCPVETPEGPNIGLISSLSNYGVINKYGLIETPYRLIDEKTHTVTDKCEYVTADIEEDKIIAQASEPLDDEGHFIHKNVASRRGPDVLEAEPEEVVLMDVSPKQVVSIGTSLIPFLEHDDTNRALMGANMQRQAVPLLRPEAPLVGTGMEWVAGQDSGVCILAKRAGTVERVTGRQIIVRADNGELDTYDIIKFMRSNQSTCINQHPIVSKGDRVEAGDTLADGMATDGGELALGHNVLVAFVSWEGYNHEDAVLISERLCKDDLYTSIHIEEYECDARDTKLGEEEITRQLSSVSEDAVKYLDENGIIMVGADVRPGDILVGKVTPKGETELPPEERLLRAIFGDKEREVRDTSLRVPHGEFGKVVDVKVFTRENGDELAPGVNKLVRVYIAQKRKIREGDKMAGRHGNKCVCSRIMPVEDMPFTSDGRPVDLVLNPLGVPSRMNIGQILEIHLSWACHMLGEEIHAAMVAGVGSPKYEEMKQRLIDCGYDFEKYGMPEPTESGIHIATPVFDGCRDEDLAATLKAAGLPAGAKTDLYDGRTGEKLDNQVTIGWKYMLKLHHLVDDKIHARSTGPYSLVTQQPLGGKAQFGGQRFGEMEVWALEAYGAAYTLQEILTVKSDDVIGRVKAYEKIVKGENIPSPGVPESFKVLMKELQSIGLDVRILNENGDEVVLKELDESDLEQGYGGGQPWHKDELKEAMEGDDAVSDSRNDMESHMNGAIENAGDDVASFNDTLEAEANAQAPVEAGFGETDLDTELGFTNDSQDD